MSNRLYLSLEDPTRHRCHTTLMVKQGANDFPVYLRAHAGYLHVDFKAHTPKQAHQKLKALFQLQCVGEFTAWGYGQLRWMFHKIYPRPDPSIVRRARFRILKGLPPNLSRRERHLVMAALWHDLMDTALYPSKLGRSLRIPDPYVRWLCVQHHNP